MLNVKKRTIGFKMEISEGLFTGTAFIIINKSPKKKNPRSTLLKGPASATYSTSFLGFFKFLTFTGTGFAHPIIGRCVINNMRGNIIVPQMSIWAMGFKVSLPALFAVSSPLKYATYPWAVS